jgi:hypothetical protein
MAQICGKYIKLAKFFVIEAVAKNYRERAKKRHARGGIF